MNILVTANGKYNIKGMDNKMYLYPEDGQFEINEDNEALDEGGVTPVDQIASLQREINKKEVEKLKKEEQIRIDEENKANEELKLELIKSESNKKDTDKDNKKGHK